MLCNRLTFGVFFYFQFGFGSNKYARRKVANYFKANYDFVRLLPWDSHDTECDKC